MSDLYSINTELMDLQRVMGAYRLDISNKEEEIKRLNEALSDLEVIKSEFHERKDICLKPEFTKGTFYGENETEIEKYRTEVLQSSFADISQKQISEAEDQIREQIHVIEQQISSLNNNISSLESEHTRVTERKAEVVSKS